MPATSSTRPLQSLSLPSQTSAVGAVEPTQLGPPFAQTVRPALHSPTQLATRPPGQPAPQGRPTSPGASSTAPSQSSSRPLQVSGVGPTAWRQVRPAGPDPGPAA